MKLFKMIRSLITLLAKIYLSAIACLILWILIPMAILWTPTVVISGSMEPLIRTGDVVSAMGVSTSQVRDGFIKPGMVVLAVDPMKPETLFTHRVIEVKPDKSMITKGDANFSPDPIALPVENVKGIELIRIPFIGLPAQKMREGDTVSVAMMALSVLLASAVLSRSRARDRNKDNDDSTPRAEIKEVLKSENNFFKKSYALAATIAAIAIVLMIGGSSAAFSGWAGQSNNSWTSADVYPSP